jgi:hypothetical protein
MKVFLVILFAFQGEPAVLEGWEPREQKSAEVCVKHADGLADYLSVEGTNLPEVIALGCFAAVSPEDAAQVALRYSGEAL